MDVRHNGEMNRHMEMANQRRLVTETQMAETTEMSNGKVRMDETAEKKQRRCTKMIRRVEMVDG